MLKKGERLSRAEFKGLTKPLSRVLGDFFLLRIFSFPSPVSKYAVSVSKKQEKSAVARNRIRRLAYRAIQDGDSVVQPGRVFHFILQKKPTNPKHDITKDIHDLILQSNRLHTAL